MDVTPDRGADASVHGTPEREEDQPVDVTPELQLSVERWYTREARLLDDRQYQKWLALCAPDVRYVVPGRGNPLVDNAERGQERMISVERELEDEASAGLPIRDESIALLTLRVERSYKPNAWAENPPARTRRLVGNVEIVGREGDRLSVLSSFHLHYARHGMRSFLYAGQRRDVLRETEEGYRLTRREVVLDLAEIDYPTLGLFF